MKKVLDGKELAGFVKERQAHVVKMLRSQKKFPCLVIIRDSDNPVITKYVNLKIQYGEDIGVKVIDARVNSTDEAIEAIKKYNADDTVSGMIVQLPLIESERTDEVVNLIDAKKDVVTATGNPHLITNEMIKEGAVVVDAGTASEGGHLVGDINEEIRAREDLSAITPKIGGVGPLTVSVLFDDVLRACENNTKA